MSDDDYLRIAAIRAIEENNRRVRAAYEQDQLVKKISEQQLREFLFYRESDAFSPLERLVIDYAVGMTRTPVDVPEELFAQLREHFDDAQLVELTAVIATENFRGRFNWAFGIGSEGFADGTPTPAAETAPA